MFSEDLYLSSETAKTLFTKYAKDLPIIDYHCHLSPKEIFEDKKFSNLGEIWLAHDHYKWRAMRAFGVDEDLITGFSSWPEKFKAFAKILPSLAGNPLYIWCALELKRYFDIDEPLCESNANEIYKKTGRMIEERGISPSWLIRRSKVEYIATTDDPADDLSYHKRISESGAYSFCRVVPAFRPDRAMGIEKPGFAEYVEKLGNAAGFKIKSFKKLIKALEARLLAFKAAGATLSDIAVTGYKHVDYTDKQIGKIFTKALSAGEGAAAGDYGAFEPRTGVGAVKTNGAGQYKPEDSRALAPDEISAYRSAFLFEIARLYAKHGVTMQCHIGALRNVNSAMYWELGPDSGYDCVDDAAPIRSYAALLDRLNNIGQVPRIILYPLDINQYEAFAALAASFGGDGPGRVQLGAPWWFNDQRYGIKKQFESAGSVYPVALSAGMLTDSRSFLSYPRHELYRRALCDYLGSLVERGEYFSGEKELGKIIRDVCYANAQRYFSVPSPSPRNFEAYPGSVSYAGGCKIFMAKVDGKKSIIVNGCGAGEKFACADGSDGGDIYDKFTGAKGFDGGDIVKICPLTHENISVLRSLFDWMNPVSMKGRKISVGLGDRLGLASAGHLRLLRDTDVFPVIAQQSMRELNLTGRTYQDVLDDACAAVFQEGYRKGFGADGDHLKSISEVRGALELGYTMITLDCSGHIDDGVNAMSPDELRAAYAALPEEKRGGYEDRYLYKLFKVEGEEISFSFESLMRIVLVYDRALTFAEAVYNEAVAPRENEIDFEISIDETLSATSPAAHFLAANELLNRGVRISGLAPRFCGEFQKGIDYIGDVGGFERDFAVHAKIARSLGYKISVHSGSDKFSVFPAIGRLAEGSYHLKTAGTNWLEAVRIIAQADPALYRAIHKFALASLDKAKIYYHVGASTENIPDVDSLADGGLPPLLDKPDSRQLLHITYGQILQAKGPDGGYLFRDKIYALLNARESEYYDALARHIGRHLKLLGAIPSD